MNGQVYLVWVRSTDSLGARPKLVCLFATRAFAQAYIDQRRMDPLTSYHIQECPVLGDPPPRAKP